MLLFNFTFEMQQTETDPQILEKQKKLWKLFGRDTKVGKELFSLYNTADKPKINYPKPKPKSAKEIEKEKEKVIADKKCPQKTQIEYPEMPRPHAPTYHPVDFIPKRKNESAIRKEIDEYYRRRKVDIPANRGIDRQKLVNKLQEKFKHSNGGLPKGAELPALQHELEFDEEKIKQQAKIKVGTKGQNFTLPVKNPQSEKALKPSFKDELEDLFDQIVAEIDERQKYLDSIEHLDEPKMKDRIKQEMLERIGELQKLTQMKK